MNKEIGFIGAGTLASALAKELAKHHYKIVGVSSRSMGSAKALASKLESCKVFNSPQALANEASLVFITTPDDIIRDIATEVHWRSGQGVVHCSGTTSIDDLSPALAHGAEIGTFHPLQSFVAYNENRIGKFDGIVLALEGNGKLLTILKEMSNNLGGRWIQLARHDKALYHASAAIASNYLVTLIAMASGLWENFAEGTQEDGVRALLPLIRGTIDNIEIAGIPACLTGPIARGDEGTLRNHLAAIPSKLSQAYREMGNQTIPLALAKNGINDAKAKSMKALFEETPTPKTSGNQIE